ncbi:hypothetical protein [Nocardia higoensis]|uniref:hypothetical protein n=1 Tax=Nocardia higoensis TaxID=228599 RepID=UPI00031C0170|nr:hypothetical protein [Nocardia higoensis]
MSGEDDGQIAAPDWVDQDLLTRDHSARLLDEEIAAEQTRLAELEGIADREETRERITRRIATMETIRARLRAANGA